MSPDTEANAPAAAGDHPSEKTIQGRLLLLKRSFQKPLRNRPTAYQRVMIDRAAALTIKAELAIYDPRMKPTEIAALDRRAEVARNQMWALINPAPKPKAKLSMAEINRQIAAVANG